jgi:predicted phosphodiesterase
VITQNTLDFNPYAVQAVFWTIARLLPENLDYLRGLKVREKLTFNNEVISIIHGSPWNDDEYVYEEQLSELFLDEVESDILIYGHTHIPCIKKFDNGLIINPGSVGQPRDYNPRASYVVLDLVNKECSIERIKYDWQEVMSKIINEGLPSLLAQRLVLGI